MRSLYVIGFLYIGVATYALWRGPAPVASPLGYTTVDVGSDGWQWFQSVKPYCNTLEVETVHRRKPPPHTLEGAGFSAACYALAANIDRSRSIIMGVEQEDRWRAAGIVFDTTSATPSPTWAMTALRVRLWRWSSSSGQIIIRHSITPAHQITPLADTSGPSGTWRNSSPTTTSMTGSAGTRSRS